MKILFISESDFNGGAARAMYRIYSALGSANVDIKMLVKYNALNNHEIIYYQPEKKEKIYNRIYNYYLSYIKIKYSTNAAKFFWHSNPQNIYNVISQIKPDILHLHWFTENFFNIEILKELNIPIVWTLHDMWAFTGGCNYTGDCTNYFEACGNCPQLKSNKPEDKSRRNLQNKKSIYTSLPNFTIIAPSLWMKKVAGNSALLSKNEIYNIPYCIDTNIYKPYNKEYARSVFNLPKDKKLILFGAVNGTGDERKGFRFLEQVLGRLDRNTFELVIFGGQETFKECNGIKVNNLNKLSDDYSLTLCYSAADIMIVPSIQENLANTILESMSCGTPVCAFKIGGNEDMIDSHINGYLADPFSVDDLHNGINFILNDKEKWYILSQNARNKIKNVFSYESIAAKHVDLYKNILEK